MDRSRVVVVIGGASGLGKEIAGALHGGGWRVTVADRHREAADAVAAALGDGATGATVDVTDESTVETLFADVAAREGAVHAVVNSAGVSAFSMLVDHDVDQWRQVVDVCLTGGFIVAKHAGRALADGGAIVSLTSLNGHQAGVGMTAYCSAKAGLSMLTRVAALELGTRGIRVNAIAPGFVETPLTAGGLLVPGLREDYVENTPLGREGTPSDIAAAAVFLCSEESAFITGTVLDVSGGAQLMRYPNLPKHVAAMASR